MIARYNTELTYQPNEKVSIKTHTIKIALLKVQPIDTVYDKLISWWTKSKYIHSELIIDNRWITSNPETGFSINTVRPIDYELYDIIDLGRVKLTSKHMDVINRWLTSLTGTKYDYLGILMSQFLPLSIDNRNKYFCSELVCKLLQMIGYEEVINKLPQNMSPADIAKLYGITE